MTRQRIRNIALSALLLTSFTLPVQAEKVFTGEVCSTRVHELTSDIHWYTNLKDAEAAAQEQGKLIFYIHMLGKLEGAT